MISSEASPNCRAQRQRTRDQRLELIKADTTQDENRISWVGERRRFELCSRTMRAFHSRDYCR